MTPVFHTLLNETERIKRRTIKFMHTPDSMSHIRIVKSNTRLYTQPFNSGAKIAVLCRP